MIELTDVVLCYEFLPALLDGLRIVQVSDLHIRRWGPAEDAILSVVRQGCEMLVVSGDNCSEWALTNPLTKFTGKHDRIKTGWSWGGYAFAPKIDIAYEVWQKILAELPADLPVVMTLGNHDAGRFVEALDPAGSLFLRNETRHYRLRETHLAICSLNCRQRCSTDWVQALSGLEASMFSIGVCHFPELSESLAAAGVPLILSGHTHGGQVCWPWGTPISTHSRTGRRYSAGLSRIGASYQYTSRGLGLSIMPIRLFCPPEIVRFTLKRGTGEPVISSAPLKGHFEHQDFCGGAS